MDSGAAAAEPTKVEVKGEKKERPKAKAKGNGKGKKGEGKGKRVDFTGPTGSGGFRLNVKNLSNETTTKEQLIELFKPFGTVSAAEVKQREDGGSRGYGYVILANEDEATAAMAEMNGKTIGGKALNVAPAERRPLDDAKGTGKGALDPMLSQAYLSQYYLAMQQQQYAAMMGGMNPYLGAGMPGMPPFPGMDPLGLGGLGMAGMGLGMGGLGLDSAIYTGSLKSVNAKSGFGFLVCSDTYKTYNRDVYIDRSLLPEGSAPGDKFTFTVSINDKGQPNAATAHKI